ncbi:MAG: sulfurtransferase [Acidobacteria bacterium]|nr:MAG: sulfurtransferase [Acidobacteriota bacterium]
MELLHKYGYSLIFVVVLLEQLGFPIPAAPVLLLAGAFSASHELKLLPIFLVGTVAAFIGDFIWYRFGKKRGRGVLTLLCRISLSPDSCVRRTEDSFLKRGMNSLLFAKFIPGLNTIAPPMAGMFQATFLGFFWRDFAGALLYVIALTIPGMIFQRRIFDITNAIESIGRAFFWVLVGGLAAYILYKLLRLKWVHRQLYKERIEPQELFERIKAGEKFTIVDLRSSVHPETQPSSLPGAIRIPPGEIDHFLDKLDKDRWIVMYCT